MNLDDWKRVFIEAMLDYKANEPQPKRKTEFSKLIIALGFIFCIGTWIVAVVSWFLWREFPSELTQYTIWYFGTVIAYMIKSGYENKAKINGRKDGNV